MDPSGLTGARKINLQAKKRDRLPKSNHARWKLENHSLFQTSCFAYNINHIEIVPELILSSIFAPMTDKAVLTGTEVGAPSNVSFVNLAFFSKRGEDQLSSDEMIAMIEDKIAWGPELCFSQAGLLLQHFVRSSILEGTSLSSFSPDQIRDCMVALHLRSRRAGCRQLNQWEFFDASSSVDWLPRPTSRPTWDQGLITRLGLVECRVIESWLTDPDALAKAEESVKENHDNESYMYSTNTRHWMDTRNHEFNVRALMTNAGFYLDTSPAATNQAAKWAKKYYEAIKASHHRYDTSIAFPWYLKIEEKLTDSGDLTPWSAYPSAKTVYSNIAGKRILLITPFADSIYELYGSGKIFHLYKSFELPVFTLKTLPTPLSTWPNRPGRSWQDSYQQLVTQCVNAIQTEGSDLVLASCGCYGLPLVHEIHAVTGVAAVYIGNFINTLFGVLQKSSKDFMAKDRNEENWAKSHLGSIPNMDRIDKGRYT